MFGSSAGQINGKQRYGVNSVSFVPADTPLKLADFFKISGVYKINSISDKPTYGGLYLDTSVLQVDYRTFIEIVFENQEDIVQSYHLNGYSFWVVGYVCLFSRSSFIIFFVFLRVKQSVLWLDQLQDGWWTVEDRKQKWL